jgi:hypothetical protein
MQMPERNKDASATSYSGLLLQALSLDDKFCQECVLVNNGNWIVNVDFLQFVFYLYPCARLWACRPPTPVHERHATLRLCHSCIVCISYGVSRSRDSAVSIATGCRLDSRGVGVKSPGGFNNFLFSSSSIPVLGPTNAYQGLFSRGVKHQEREADHSHLTNAKSRKCGSIHPLPVRLHGVVLN